jgi:hypothetical protein
MDRLKEQINTSRDALVDWNLDPVKKLILENQVIIMESLDKIELVTGCKPQDAFR